MEDPAAVHELTIDVDPIQVREARNFFAKVAAHVEIEPEHVTDGQLALTELVTNAVRHAGPPITVRAYVLADALRVEVTDPNPAPPVIVDADLTQTGGRGLTLVQAIAAAWGYETHPARAGKTVWFTLPIRT